MDWNSQTVGQKLYIHYWELNQLKLQCISLQRTVNVRELIARSLVYCGNVCVIILKIGQRIYVMSPM